MALILNIETSAEVCSVALSKNGKLIASLNSETERSHASVLTVLIERLLLSESTSVSQLDAVALSKGPGSYTGLRIGVSAAKGICYGADKPLIAVNTLESMFNGLKLELGDRFNAYSGDTIFCPMIDARRQEVYMAWFNQAGQFVKDTVAEIITADSFADELAKTPMVFFGNGAAKCKSLLTSPRAEFIDTFTLKAGYLAPLAEQAFENKRFENLAYFEPFYLKDFVATTPKRKVI